MIVIAFLLVVLVSLSQDNPLFGLMFVRYIQYTLIVARVIYVVLVLSMGYIGFVGVDEWLHYYSCFGIDFGTDVLSLNLASYNLDLEFYIGKALELMLPTAYAEEIDPINLDPSFNSILADTSPGGLLVTKFLEHIVMQNKLGFNIFLSPVGIKESHKLIDMINHLPLDNSSNFAGDNALYDYIINTYKYEYMYNMELSLTAIKPTISYTLPLYKQMTTIPSLNSGIYAFVHESGACGVGSAYYLRPRLATHMSCFNGHDLGITYMHK